MLKTLFALLLKLAILYFMAFGFVGMMMVLEDALFDYHSIGRFFLRTSAMDFVRAFFTFPMAVIKVVCNDFLALFNQNRVEQPVIDFITVGFLGFSLTGIYAKHDKMLYLAILFPLLWGMMETRPWRWFS